MSAVSPLPSRPSPGLVNRHIFDRNPSKEVGAVAVYRQDACVFRGLTHRQSRQTGGGIRRNISGFSRQSRKRMVFSFRNMPVPRIMITLTYPRDYPSDGKTVKRHLHNFRKFLARKGVKDAWFLEFQNRGAPHFHLFTDLPVSSSLVSHAWYRIVGSGDEKHLRAGTKVEWLRNPNAAGIYASKYASKSEQKEVPQEYENVGRFWGMCRSLKPQPVFHYAALGRLTRIDALTGEVIQSSIYPYIRMLRNLYNSRRRKWGKRAFRDRGYYGVTFWGCGASAGVS